MISISISYTYKYIHTYCRVASGGGMRTKQARHPASARVHDGLSLLLQAFTALKGLIMMVVMTALDDEQTNPLWLGMGYPGRSLLLAGV